MVTVPWVPGGGVVECSEGSHVDSGEQGRVAEGLVSEMNVTIDKLILGIKSTSMDALYMYENYVSRDAKRRRRRRGDI